MTRAVGLLFLLLSTGGSADVPRATLEKLAWPTAQAIHEGEL
jgi:hypothetical protein